MRRNSNHEREALQKVILRRYRKQFMRSVAITTLILLILVPLVFLALLAFSSTRIWYASDPLYRILKFLEGLSPFAVIALWIAGVAFALYRQWQQSAADVVGLIKSIEQMQNSEGELIVEVPTNLAEIKPIIQDIYDTGQENQRLAREAERRRNELIAYLAHDLRTPLTSIIGYLSLLVEQPDMMPSKRAEFSNIAFEKAIRLEELINQFFEISRYNMNEMTLVKERFDLKYLLIQLADEFFPILEAEDKRIVIRIPEELWLNGDAGKLSRVFNNILRNAVAYGYKDSMIVIAATQLEHTTMVTISNRGPTIPNEQLQRIFTKFFRLDDARSTDTGGAGLGLAIAKEIVLLHGGDILAESVSETTSFSVTLPN